MTTLIRKFLCINRFGLNQALDNFFLKSVEPWGVVVFGVFGPGDAVVEGDMKTVILEFLQDGGAGGGCLC